MHVHHLTYARAGYERPEDLQHICLSCHMDAHPDRAERILFWERMRVARILAGEEREQEQQQEREEERPEELALNSKNYRASGYCLADVEQEEFVRAEHAPLTPREIMARQAFFQATKKLGQLSTETK